MRIAAALSTPVAPIWFGISESLVFVVVLGVLILPRVARLAGPFDAAFSSTILLAAWSGVAGLYAAIGWWDLVVHFITVGASAAVLFLFLARLHVTPGTAVGKALPSRSIVVLTFAFGISVAVLWEFAEWIGNAVFDAGLNVGYGDTLGDLAVGGLGAIVAGLALARWKDRTAEIQNSARK